MVKKFLTKKMQEKCSKNATNVHSTKQQSLKMAVFCPKKHVLCYFLNKNASFSTAADAITVLKR